MSRMLEITNPRQTVLVTCRHRKENTFTGNTDDLDNVLAIDWHMPVSFKPNYYAISVAKGRYSHDLIKESNVYVVNFVGLKMAKKVDFCGRNHGRHKDKFKLSGLTKEEAENVDCCRVGEAMAYLECEVTNSYEIGDHTIFVGKVVGSLHKKEEDRLFHKLHGEYGTLE